ncbi:PhoH family protein [Halanaerobacter jeridensis]|uniref:PhoH-like ATPase n=1 Tax=Halanaerobacter jeridensis TaxID=706427 RepID=A0A938XQ92_9FIRM|nr:PhoH family protein [Halanaerobacter jeridensis]MBM7555466.1 PhoH-like ATPase [Halanaerobacter jeridensis]
MEKIYVLDTNVILHDPQSIFSFEDNQVIIPMIVLEEVDQQKKRQDSVGRNARVFSRYLDDLREKYSLSEGAQLDNGGILKTEITVPELNRLPSLFDETKADNFILETALKVEEETDKPVILVSKDINMRIKASIINSIEAENYETDAVDINELYSGIADIDLSSSEIDQFYNQEGLEVDGLDITQDLMANEVVNLEDKLGSSQSALGIYEAQREMIRPFIFSSRDVWGINARNREQRGAFELLLNDDIKLVTLVGKAGTGKTLLALASGLHKVLEENKYKRLIVTRPIMPMGKDIGYLPGDKREKLAPWMKPIFDNMEFLLGGRDKNAASALADLEERDLLEMEAITHIRGRSIPNQFMIVDEAQNLTPHEVKTIVTRVGENTKVILTGDPYQIDHPYLDSDSNGLTYLVERMKDKEITGHITLVKGERSELAELGASCL